MISLAELVTKNNTVKVFDVSRESRLFLSDERVLSCLIPRVALCNCAFTSAKNGCSGTRGCRRRLAEFCMLAWLLCSVRVL